MLDDLGKMLVDRYKNPCKKCIVRATCEPFTANCNKWEEFIDQRDNAESIGNDVEAYILLGAIIIGLLFIILTFGLGLWVWFDIIVF